LKFIVTLVLIFIYNEYSLAQKQANNWFYGHFIGITFNNHPPVMLGGGQTQINEGCSSISDHLGNLLFYSDGVDTWDRNHAIMPNGSGLHGNNSSSQSCIITPMPGNENEFYLFTAPDFSTGFGLEYSIVDITLNGGMGDITSVKNITLLPNSTEKITAVYHANGSDYWVIGHEFESANFYAWLVTSTGISLPVISSIGTPHESDPLIWNSLQNKIGNMKASPCGDRLACTVLYDSFLELFDFDDSTGVVSNPLYLGAWPGLFPYGIYGVEFSPGCSKLYASSINPAFVVQYDLSSGSHMAILASADTVITSSSDYFGALQNGPDRLMYLSRGGNSYLGCITMPDLPGTSCTYVDSYVDGGGTAVYGLPNFLTSWFKNITTPVNQISASDQFTLYYNSFSSDIHFNTLHPGNGRIELFNSTGQLILYNEISGSQSIIRFDSYPKGMYFITVQINGVSHSLKFIKS
jgi:hypothetical protein